MALNVPQRRLRAGRWAMQIAGFSCVLILVGGVLHRLFDLATPVALNLFALAFAGAVVSLLIAAYALWRVWQTGYRGSGSAFVAVVVAGTILMWPISLLPTVQSLPNINDVSTDTERPPQFVEIAKLRTRGSNRLDYPGKRFAQAQAEAYPDLRTLEVERGAAETVTLVAQALRKLRMDVVREDAPDSNQAGYVEAVDRTLVFGFRDDVVVRVRARGGGALVDVRSASRYGRHDLGSNAARVRDIMAALVERIQATVPKNGARRRR